MPNSEKRVRVDRNRPQWIDLGDWKSLAGDEGDNPERYCLHKTVAGAVVKEESEASDMERTIKFVVSDATVDRDKDVVDPKGWMLDNYNNNPVVLFGHDYHSLPVARSISITLEGGKLVSTAKFATAEENPFADSVYRMLKGGFLNAVSAGFIPTAYKENKERGGYDFTKQELLEYSVVPIPANAQALVQARSAGIPLEPLKDWAKEVLDHWDDSTDEEGKYKTVLEAFCKDYDALEEGTDDDSSDVARQVAKDMETILDESVQKEEVEPEPTPEVSKEVENKEEVPEEGVSKDLSDNEVVILSLCAELSSRGFEVRVNQEPLEDAVKTAHEGTGVDCTDWSDDQIFDYLCRHKDADMQIEVTDNWFDYPLTELTDISDQKSTDDVVMKELAGGDVETKTVVQKVNPIVVNSVLPQSFEAVRSGLYQAAKDFLTSNGQTVREYDDFIVMVGTFQKDAVFCVAGWDRSWEDDPTYRGKWKMNRQYGMAEWVGEPERVEVNVSMEVVEASVMSRDFEALTKKKETLAQKATQSSEVETKGKDQESVETKEEDQVTFDDGSTTTWSEIEKALESCDVTKTLDTSEIKDVLVGAVRQAQGRV